MQPLIATASSAAVEMFIRHLAGGFAPASFDAETRHRFDAVPRGAQRLQSLGQAKAEWTDNPCSDDCNTGRATFPV
ncbi:MAG: hypothetical protein DME34_10335 [Verrucomicrobia bacterium]|nr:MAG: hypothetical protein DME34_10335 [Verrucomicrobiota bacterium]